MSICPTFLLIPLFLVWSINSLLAQGDSCTTAVIVSPGVHVADGPATGGGYSGNSCDAQSPDPAINSDWYSFTPVSNGLARVFQCTVDTRAHIRTGTCGSLTCVAGNDDDSTPTGSGACNNLCCGSSTDFTVTGGTEYFIEWDDRWTNAGFTWNLEFHDCEAPEATFTRVNDCPNFEYSIDVDLTSLGTSAAVDIINDGGAPDLLGVAAGMYTVGPFVSGTAVTVTVVHDSDPFCDLTYGPVVNYPCPIISCGPDNYTYCYGDNDTTIFLFQSATTDPVVIQFNGGGINTFGDSLFIYDGDNVGSPVLFAGDNGGNLGGVTAISTNPGNYLMLQSKSNAFTSCQSGGASPAWNWDVICLDCTAPQVQFLVQSDCQHREYEIEVSLADLGGSSTVDILNSGGAPDVLGATTGNYSVGPFAMDDSVQISIVHDNPLCSMQSPWYNFLFDSCAVVSCGQDNYDYCYENNDESWWLYKSANGDVLTLNFTAGDIALGDIVTIYNGATENAGVLYSGNFGGDLTGLDVVSNNPQDALLLRFLSDADLSCDDGFSPTQASWSVQCSGVGIDEVELAKIGIYPNPNDGIFNLKAISRGQADIEVFDLLGEIVYSKSLNLEAGTAVAVQIDPLISGTYYLRVTQNGKTSMNKISVLR